MPLVAPVRVELLAGARQPDLNALRRTLWALPCWYPDSSTWETVDDWIDVVVAAGQRFGFGDLLIAAIADRHGAAVWSLDPDFERLARLELVRLHV